MQTLTEIKTAGNSTFAIGGVPCFADTFVVAESFVLSINISAEKPAHRKSANRYHRVEPPTNFKQDVLC